MVDRVPAFAGAGEKPFFLGEILKQKPPARTLRRAIKGDPEAGQNAPNMLVMLRHHRADRPETDFSSRKIEKERVVFRVPLLANGDDFCGSVLAEIACHDV